MQTSALAQAMKLFFHLIERTKPSPECKIVDLLRNQPISYKVNFSPTPITYCLFPRRPKSGCKPIERIGQSNMC